MEETVNRRKSEKGEEEKQNGTVLTSAVPKTVQLYFDLFADKGVFLIY